MMLRSEVAGLNAQGLYFDVEGRGAKAKQPGGVLLFAFGDPECGGDELALVPGDFLADVYGAIGANLDLIGKIRGLIE